MSTYDVGSVEISLITQMDEVSKKITQVSADLKNLKRGISDNKKEIKNTGESAKKLGNNFKEALNLGKLYVALNYIRRYSQTIRNTVKSSIDYVETVNKFKVSMGDMYKDAMKFQNKINEKFGLSKSLLMDYQANFNNIIKGLGGVDKQLAYGLSETLTQMSIDFSSLFNVSMESAVQKFQAALTGQVRPIRSVSGFDITQQTLQGTLKEIGINDRKISQMSQIEKRLLIIITLQKQMNAVAASGDFSNTIEEPANQLRILKETLKDVTIAFGNFILGTLKPALAYVNGFFMATKEILEVFSMLKVGDIAKEHEMPNKNNKSNTLDNLLQPDKATDGVKRTEKAVKDLKNAVLGIDELNIISPTMPSQSIDGGVGGIGGMAVDPRILQAISDYNSALDDTHMKATTIRDRIMEWLGFHQAGTDELGNTNWELDQGITRFEIIKGIIEGILKLTGILLATKAITKIMNLLGFAPGKGTVFGALAGVSLILEGLKLSFDGLGNLLDGDVSNDIEGLIHLITGAVGLAAGMVIIQGLLSGTNGLTTLFSAFGVKVLLVVGVITALVGVVSLVVMNFDKMSNTQKVVAGLAIIATAAGAAAIAWATLSASATAAQSAITLGVGAAAIVAGIAAVSFAIKGITKDAKAAAKVPRGYATGGFPTRGDYFLANENGVPEYVGSIGGKTAVANTNQIVEGISIGVSRANERSDSLAMETNRLLKQLLAKDSNTYLDGRIVNDQLQKSRDGRGFNGVIGGAAFV